MPSVIDICNLALGHIGDEANVSAIDPPDGSAQAVHCSRFYPIARDSLLEMHDWNFASTRIELALLEVTLSQWAYAYAAPNNMIAARKVLDAAAPDDWSYGLPAPFAPMPLSFGFDAPPEQGVYTPRRYVVETIQETGAKVIYTNQQNALLLFTRQVDDPTKFSPLFVQVLSFLLASYLAGPIIKGDEGRNVATAMLRTAMSFLPSATSSDANQRRVDVASSVPWIAGR